MTRPESQPRHPLELLADGWEARARLLSENARAEQSEQSARYYAARAAEAQDCATQLREALRAQAEAEAGLREALAYYADFDGEHVSALGQYWVRRERADGSVYWESDRGQTARAALAQAGGES